MKKSYFERNFHFYMDEGGMFGNCTVLLSDSKLSVQHENSYHISHYYFGFLNYISIIRHVQLFKSVFPNCLIMLEVGSKYLDTVLLERSINNDERY